MTVTQPTVPGEGGVASQPVNRHMNARVGRAQPTNCLCQWVCVIETWRSRFFLDTLCCLWIVRELPVRILSSYILCYMDNIGVYHCLAVRYDTVNLSSVHADMLLNQKWSWRYLSCFWSILVVPWIDAVAATEQALVKILSTVNWLLHIAIWPFKNRNRIWSYRCIVLQCNDCLLRAKWRSV